MAWHYLPELLESLPSLPEQEADFSGHISSASALSVPWKSSRIVERCSSDANGTACYPCSLYGTTCEPSTESHGVERWMSLLEVSPAPILAKLGEGWESKERKVGSGQKWLGSFTRYDPFTSSWRTHQTSLLGGSTEFSETWPQWGFMRNGECWELPTLVPPTSEEEYGFLPTPTCHTFGFSGSNGHRQGKAILGRNFYYIQEMEALMGFPEGWTALEPLAMPKFLKWLEQHGVF